MTAVAERALALLRDADVRLGPGLTDAELDRLERDLALRFARDHRALLRRALPLGPRWVDWRDASYDDLRERLDRPVDGVLLDVRHNGFWPLSWGRRPDDERRAEEKGRRRLDALPRLVPLRGHRYVTPAGSVLSVHQSDVVHYGADLAAWAALDLASGPRRTAAPRSPGPGTPRAAFWGELADGVLVTLPRSRRP